ncbi:unnamed protein product [Brassica rapa subsp. trilocularis]
MLTLGWMMESRASISTTWTNQTDLDSPVHQNSSLCPDQYTDQSMGRASMLICVLTLTCSSVVETYHRVVHNSPCTSMKLPFYTHLPLRLSWPLGMNSGHLPSLLTICVCSQALEDALAKNMHLALTGSCTVPHPFALSTYDTKSSSWTNHTKSSHGLTRSTSVGADLGGNSKYSNENFEGRRGERFHKELSFLFNSLPTLETAQPEVGSSGWKSTARRVVSGAFPAALENPEDRVPLTPGRTHNRIRSPRQGKSAKWIRNFGKRIGSEGWAWGSQFRTRRLLAGCLSC